MEERFIDCIQCQATFILTSQVQRWLQERGFDEPTRCPECRKKKSNTLYVERDEAVRNRKNKNLKHHQYAKVFSGNLQRRGRAYKKSRHQDWQVALET